LRELIALILTAVVAYVVWQVFLVGNVDFPGFGGGDEIDPADLPPDTVLPMEAELAVGEGATVVVGGVRYALGLGMVADNRCPRGKPCDDPGKATVVTWIDGPGVNKVQAKLSTADRVNMPLGPVAVRLVNLDPYPTQGETLRRNQYRAKVVIEEKSAAEEQAAS
jgi:hypothetical protein